jgi:ketosteroid isomerase-like protein
MRLPALAAAALLAGAPLFSQSEDPRRAIREAQRQFADAEARRDLPAAAAALYADDVILIVLGREPLRGREELSRLMASMPESAIATHETFETQSLDVSGDQAVEIGAVVGDRAGRGFRAPYLAVWRRVSGSWRVWRAMWGEESGTTPAIAPPPASIVPPLMVPDARSLGEGYVRSIRDDLASHRRRAQAASGRGDRAAAEKEARWLETLVRDVGWIDVRRFGVAAACDAARIVVAGGSPALREAARPRVEDLRTTVQAADCWAEVSGPLSGR